MPPPPLAVITVCRNIAAEIDDTCASVVKQTFQDFEWIVVDGASTDGTLDVLEKYRSRITRLISEPDAGIYNAMNKGIRAATGEYLLFLNGGDYLASDAVLTAVLATGALGGADIIYGNPSFRTADKVENGITPPLISKIYFVKGWLNHQNVFIRRELFTRHGLYDESYRLVADWEKWVAFAANGCSFAHIDLGITVFRTNGASAAAANDREMRAEKRRVRQKHFSAAEIAAGRKLHNEIYGYKTLRSWWRGIFSVTQSADGAKTKYNFCGLPLLKIKRSSPVKSIAG
ncbi:MAG: glycosyltransferase [Planctomycetota bacterium]|jgi:glycosyltransferase involved in cell wall biosynthesis|nr:glycosyltransferase [Planctomycetota bacterium]